jgi:hypothetical protein
MLAPRGRPLTTYWKGTSVSDALNDAVFAPLEPHGSLTSEVIVALAKEFGTMTVDEFRGTAPGLLTVRMKQNRDNNGLPADIPASKAVLALLDFMDELRVGVAAPQPVAPGLPSEIKLITDKHPRDMSLRELLAKLRDNPASYAELKDFVMGNQWVLDAISVSGSIYWVIMDPKVERLDVEATMDYLHRLTHWTQPPKTTEDGRYPVEFTAVFGDNEPFLVNPFATSSRDMAVRGPVLIMGDRTYHLRDLGSRRQAYVWAAFYENVPDGHLLWPEKIDPAEHIPAAFAPTLAPSGRWATIIRDYEAAVRRDPALRNRIQLELSRMEVEALAGAVAARQEDEPEHDEAWYKAELRKRCGQTGIDMGGGSRIVRNSILPSIHLGDGVIRCSKVLVLDSLRYGSGAIDGDLWVHEKTAVKRGSGEAPGIRYCTTWRELYYKAIEFELFVV